MTIINRIIKSLCIAAVLYLLFSALFGLGVPIISGGLFTLMGFIVLFFFVWAEWEFLRI